MLSLRIFSAMSTVASAMRSSTHALDPLIDDQDVLPCAGLGTLRHRYFTLRHGQSEANVANIIISEPSVGTLKYGLTPAGVEMVQASAASFAEEVLKASPPPRALKIVASDFKRTQETARVFVAALREKLKGSPLVQALEPTKAMRLRERYFGELDNEAGDRYNDVWEVDQKDSSESVFGAETADAVVKRTVSVVRDLESLPLAAIGNRVKIIGGGSYEGEFGTVVDFIDIDWWGKAMVKMDSDGLTTIVNSDEVSILSDANSGQAVVVLVSHGDALQLLQTAFHGVEAGTHRSLKHMSPAEMREMIPTAEGLELICGADAGM